MLLIEKAYNTVVVQRSKYFFFFKLMKSDFMTSLYIPQLLNKNPSKTRR